MSHASVGRVEAAGVAVAVGAGVAGVAGVAATCHWEAGGSVLDFGRAAVAAWRLDVATGRRVVEASVVVEAVTLAASLADSLPVPADSSVMPPMRLDRLPGFELETERQSGLDFRLVATDEVVAVVVGALLVEQPSGHAAALACERSDLGSIAVHYSAYSGACFAEPDFAVVVA